MPLNSNRRLTGVYAPDHARTSPPDRQDFRTAIQFYRNYLLIAVGHFDNRLERWTPIVDLRSPRDGRANVKLVTGKSFNSKKTAAMAGIEMAKNWIDVFSKL